MEKNIYIGLILVSLFVLIASFFSYKQIKESDLVTKQGVLSKSEWKMSSDSKKGETHWLELSFWDIKSPLKIIYEDFEKLKKVDFKKDIAVKDTLTIKYEGGLIYHLSKNGKEYTSLDEANLERNNTFKDLRLTAGLCLVLCLLLLKFRT